MPPPEQMLLEQYEEKIGFIIILFTFIIGFSGFYKLVIKNEIYEWVNEVRQYCYNMKLPFNENSILYKPLSIKLTITSLFIVSTVALAVITYEAFFK